MAPALSSPDSRAPARAVPHRVLRPLGVAVGLLLAALALRLRDPHVGGSWGFCPLRALTGLDCPACGGLRAVNDLTHLRLDAAFHSNALLVLAAPVVVAAWVWWLRRSWTGRPVAAPSPRRARALAWTVAALVLAFTVFRNTAWGHGYWA